MQVINKAFISPEGSNRNQMTILFDRVRDIILNHYATTLHRNPLPEYTDIEESMYQFPDQGLNDDKIFSELSLVFAKSMNHVSPDYIGHMDSMPTTMSIIGEVCKAAINNNMLGFEMSPVFTRMESSVLGEFANLFGLGKNSGGVMGSGGSLVNLQAMTCARNVKLSLPDGDLTQLKEKPIVFASVLAHASIEKNMMILGLGKSNLEKITIDEEGRMSISHLKERIMLHENLGNQPFCVVATLATTAAGSIDPICEISEICHEHGLWLHADAVYGGAAILSDTYRHTLNGIEKADSVTFNPQKWMNIAKTCSMLLFKDFRQAIDHFKTDMPYYGKEKDSYYNLGEISIQGSRSAEILKLWLSLRHIGKKGYEFLIDRSYDFTFYFEKLIDQCKDIEKFTRPETNTLLFRLNRNADSDQTTVDLQRYLLQEKGIHFGLQTVASKKWLKFLVLNPYTTEETLDFAVKCINEFTTNQVNIKRENIPGQGE